MNASSFRRLFLNQVLWQLSAIALLIGTVEGQQAAPAGTALIVGGTVVNVFESNTERIYNYKGLLGKCMFKCFQELGFI